ncbi:glutaredoxin protein [Rhizobium phage RHph_I1_18]|nr:glutaredoxin protein [Rhizobium phage RHph_I1_18]
MEVTVYTRKNPPCPYCEETKATLIKHGIAFEEIDVSKPGFDKEHLKTVIAPGATTVPVIFINGKWLKKGNEALQKLDLEALKKIKYPEDKFRAKLRGDICEVTFIKVDGSTRVMKATLNQRVIPVDKHPKTDDTSDTTSEDTITTIVKAYDIEAHGWRSIDLTRVIQVEQLT